LRGFVPRRGDPLADAAEPPKMTARKDRPSQPHRTPLSEVRPAMKRLLSAVLGFALLTSAAQAGPVKIPDKGLEEALKKFLLEPKEGLTDENLINVNSTLEAVGKGIKDLTGLEKCKNLKALRLTKNEVSDLKPLKDLKDLQSLDLEDNKIGDITLLAGLTNLQYLHLAGNKLTKIDAVKDMTALASLYLSRNEISDLAPLAKLTKLSSLYLDGNKVSDIKALTGLTRLSSLDLKNNTISDLTPLAKQTDLKMLFLERNKITDLKPLVEWLKADAAGEKRVGPYLFLYLEGNPLSEEAKAKQVPALEALGVRLKLKDAAK
jgi:Leucine-rich repeat (LRR) protein